MALRLLIEQLCAMLNDPDWARVLPALFALRNQEHGIAALELRLEERQEDAVVSVLERGIAEGRLDPHLDVDQASALLVGPLLFANLMGKPAVDEAFADHVVDVFLRTHAAP